MDISKFRATKDASDEDAWTKWLADEDTPPPNATAGYTRAPKPARSALDFRNPQPTRTQPRAQKQAPAGSESFSISIQMPRVSGRAVRTAWRRSWPWLAGALSVVGVLYGGNQAMHYLGERNKAQEQNISTKPSYAPLKPTDSDQESVSASTNFDSEQQLYKYNDTLMGSEITVSQQPLPEDIRENPEKIATVAERSIQATDSFDTYNGKVYIATDETGYQRLVLVHRQLLVFITSPREIDIPDWVTYIQSLR